MISTPDSQPRPEQTTERGGRKSNLLRAAVILLTPLILLAGGLFWGGVVAPGYWSSIILITLWFIAVGVVGGQLRKRRPELNWALRGSFLACVLVSLSFGYLTSVRDTTVNEKLPTGVPASKLPGAKAPGEKDPLAPQTGEKDPLAPQE